MALAEQNDVSAHAHEHKPRRLINMPAPLWNTLERVTSPPRLRGSPQLLDCSGLIRVMTKIDRRRRGWHARENDQA